MSSPAMLHSNPNLEQAAHQVVNQVFWGAMLREFRTAHQDPILGGSPGGGAFIQQLDQVLLERMSQRGKSPLVDALLKQLDSQGRYTNRTKNEIQGVSV